MEKTALASALEKINVLYIPIIIKKTVLKNAQTTEQFHLQSDCAHDSAVQTSTMHTMKTSEIPVVSEKPPQDYVVNSQ